MAKDDCFCPPGAPLWMVTFADLMSLLVCFFVLLISFSTMELARFYDMVGSMKDAFGITLQKRLKAVEEVEGSPYLEEVSQIRPVPMATIAPPVMDMERTIEEADVEEMLQAMEEAAMDAMEQGESVEAAELTQIHAGSLQDLINDPVAREQLKAALQAEDAKKMQQDATKTKRMVREALGKELQQGELTLVELEDGLMLRFPDKLAFGSGGTEFSRRFSGILRELGMILSLSPGQVIVSGHSDNQPISTPTIPSNWHLSSNRAIAVGRFLAENSPIDERRLVMQGHGANKPIADNNTPEGRSANRRVEIILKGER